MQFEELKQWSELFRSYYNSTVKYNQLIGFKIIPIQSLYYSEQFLFKEVTKNVQVALFFVALSSFVLYTVACKGRADLFSNLSAK